MISQAQLAHVQVPLTEHLCSMQPEFSSKLCKCTQTDRQTDIYKCMCFLCVHLKRFCAILLGQLSSTVFSLFILPLDQCVSHWFWMSNSSLQRISYFIISSCFIVVVCWLPTSHCYVVSCEIVAAAATLIQILVKVI